ncbi:MAG: pyridoxal phosphate-dependent aminotransferase [Candidatus Shapirobacteria bacterium]|jgi:aspartate/methionine/tyrosine aminotransferase
MIQKNIHYKIKRNNDIQKCLRAFNSYYSLLRTFIDRGVLKSSLDRGAFTHPSQILNKEFIDLLGTKRHRISLGYGQEAGEQILREKIVELENLKYGTNYKAENVTLVAGAWSGVELVIEEISKLYNGNYKKLKIAVIGPTHYQLFQRPIEVLGLEVLAFDFTKLEGSVPTQFYEIDEILKTKPDVVFVTNPNNPNGEYIPSDILKYLVRKTQNKNIYVVIDELQNFMPAKNKDIGYGKWIQQENIIRIDSFSKHYALAEYRHGWVIASNKITGDRYSGIVGRIRGFMGNGPRACNDVILKLIQSEIDYKKGKAHPLEKKWNTLLRKHDYIVKRLSKNSRITILPRDACFNVCIKVSGFKNDMVLSKKLMEEGTLIMPCEGYGYESEDVIMRITFAERWSKVFHSMSSLEKVINNVKENEG